VDQHFCAQHPDSHLALDDLTHHRHSPRKTLLGRDLRFLSVGPTAAIELSIQLDLESGTTCWRTSDIQTCHTAVSDSRWKCFLFGQWHKSAVINFPLEILFVTKPGVCLYVAETWISSVPCTRRLLVTATLVVMSFPGNSQRSWPSNLCTEHLANGVVGTL